MTRRAAFCLTVLAAASLGSCGDIGSRWAVLSGNLRYSRAEYPEAIAAYSGAAVAGSTAAYANYGLALTYEALGETTGALERYLEAAETSDNGLRSSAYYNAGIVEFRRMAYGAAADYFRKALESISENEANPENTAGARRNLELSLRLLAAAGEPASTSSGDKTEASMETAASGPTAESAVRAESVNGNQWLFDHIQREEAERWRSREWSGDDVDGPDY